MVQVKLELVHPVFVLMISGLRKPLKSFKHEIKRSVHFDKCWEGQEQSGAVDLIEKGDLGSYALVVAVAAAAE